MRHLRELALVCGLALLLGTLLAAGAAWYVAAVPGASFAGPRPAPRDVEAPRRLRAHVEALASEIGERSFDQPDGLEAAARYVEGALRDQGYAVRAHVFDTLGEPVRNLEAERAGSSRADEIVVIGAHYDTVYGSPGADDNASGVAVLLELARALRADAPERTLRFVAFANEEPPFFQTEDMGSLAYAAESAGRGERVVAMLSVESVGRYDERPGSQSAPRWLGRLFPDRGDFVAFVANPPSRALLHEVLSVFRGTARLPSEGAALPGFVSGVGWSDQWSFWQHGVPALMVTDTAPYRSPDYHTERDTAEKLDYDAMAELADGLAAVVRALALASPGG